MNQIKIKKITTKCTSVVDKLNHCTAFKPKKALHKYTHADIQVWSLRQPGRRSQRLAV